MFLIIGALIGLNLCVRIVLGETRERRLAGRVGARGGTRLRLEDYVGIAWRALLFLIVPVAIGLLLDNIFGTGFEAVFSD
jgi:hypothetical protein